MWLFADRGGEDVQCTSVGEQHLKKRRPDHTPPRTRMAQPCEEETTDCTTTPTWSTELTTLIRAMGL
ncbi:hypothetical protein EOD39_19011 [Acipenser ruthenus]|uniref:Uncharacterized protein n=1 Tax=Acipenser ruthenus TaxID=7906 RepID=A0A444UZH0_ACIRT|nr:hypothetical protein EOD39_19011 [Acipenser ruthenus]